MFCHSQAYPTENKPENAFFYLQKNPKLFKKARISKCGFKKTKLATLLHKN